MIWPFPLSKVSLSPKQHAAVSRLMMISYIAGCYTGAVVAVAVCIAVFATR